MPFLITQASFTTFCEKFVCYITGFLIWISSFKVFILIKSEKLGWNASKVAGSKSKNMCKGCLK